MRAMRLELSEQEVALAIRALEQAAVKLPAYFDKREADRLLQIVHDMRVRRKYLEKKDFNKCPYESHALDCECHGMGGDR